MVADATTLEAPRVATRFESKYLSFTSFKRDGTPVSTPVWFVEDGARLLVQTDAASGKVKRIKRDPHITIAPCSARGKPRSEPVPAVAELLPDDELPQIVELIEEKYRRDLVFIKPIRTLQEKLHIGKKRTREVAIAITRA